MTDNTQTYQHSDEDNKTQTYQSNATRTYTDATQTYREKEPGTTGTMHNLNVGQTITLNETTYTLTGIISEQTGEKKSYP